MLAGKNIIVTGATSGIGEAMTAKLSKEGANLFIGGRRKDNGEKVAKATKSYFHVLDVGVEASNKAFFEAAKKHFGGDNTVDYVFLNAGMDGKQEETVAPNISLDNFELLFLVNVGSLLNGLKYGVSALKKGGVIVPTSSAGSILPFGINPVYGASKAAVDALVRSYAAQFAESKDEQIKSLSIIGMIPTLYASDMSANFFENDKVMQAAALSFNVCQRVGKPSEIGDTIFAFVQGKLPYKSGDSFVVDGDDNFPLAEFLARLQKAQGATA